MTTLSPDPRLCEHRFRLPYLGNQEGPWAYRSTFVHRHADTVPAKLAPFTRSFARERLPNTFAYVVTISRGGGTMREKSYKMFLPCQPIRDKLEAIASEAGPSSSQHCDELVSPRTFEFSDWAADRCQWFPSTHDRSWVSCMGGDRFVTLVANNTLLEFPYLFPLQAVEHVQQAGINPNNEGSLHLLILDFSQPRRKLWQEVDPTETEEIGVTRACKNGGTSVQWTYDWQPDFLLPRCRAKSHRPCLATMSSAPVDCGIVLMGEDNVLSIHVSGFIFRYHCLRFDVVPRICFTDRNGRSRRWSLERF